MYLATRPSRQLWRIVYSLHSWMNSVLKFPLRDIWYRLYGLHDTEFQTWPVASLVQGQTPSISSVLWDSLSILLTLQPPSLSHCSVRAPGPMALQKTGAMSFGRSRIVEAVLWCQKELSSCPEYALVPSGRSCGGPKQRTTVQVPRVPQCTEQSFVHDGNERRWEQVILSALPCPSTRKWDYEHTFLSAIPQSRLLGSRSVDI